MRGALGLTLLACVMTAASAPRLDARQARTARDAVYTAAQAARGQALYRARCGACDGETLGGDLGPPLAGQLFLSTWSGQPLAGLFDKIRSTMPEDAPGTLAPAQVADLLAFMLQANRFPAGAAALGADDAALRAMSLGPAASATQTAPAGPAMSFPPVGNLNQVMRGTLFPSSNVLFDVQTQDPSARQSATRPEAATTTARYGDVYDPWAVVDAAAIAIAESGAMLMTPGRRCQNGQPVPVDRADWRQYVQGLVDTGRAAYTASQSRKQEAVSEVTNQISDACANCHRVYRDTATSAMRCTPPQ